MLLGCSQTCVNATCTCEPDYVLEADNKTCTEIGATTPQNFASNVGVHLADEPEIHVCQFQFELDTRKPGQNLGCV